MTAKKTKAVITLADMPPGTVANISGKEFPQFKGLLPLAHQHGIQSMHTDLVSFADGVAIVKAVAIGTRGTFEAYGDASPENVPRGAHHEVIRRAETRAYSRALRLYTGIGACAADELAADGAKGSSGPPQSPAKKKTGQNSRQASKPAQTASQPPQQAQGDIDGGPRCPECGAGVWDNRGTAQGKSPLWRCKDGPNCPGGKGDFGWASWDADFFDSQARAQSLDHLDGAGLDVSGGYGPPPDDNVAPFPADDELPF